MCGGGRGWAWSVCEVLEGGGEEGLVVEEAVGAEAREAEEAAGAWPPLLPAHGRRRHEQLIEQTPAPAHWRHLRRRQRHPTQQTTLARVHANHLTKIQNYLIKKILPLN